MKKKQFYLIIYISSAGAKYTTFKLTNKKPDAAQFTRGEGNCLIFRLIDGDYSTAFYDALQDGTIMNQIGDFHIEGSINIEKIAKQKEKFFKAVKKIQAQYNGSGNEH